MKTASRALAAALLLFAGFAQATFHLWSMTELYSNADGSVQFLELRALAGGQQFMAEHVLSTSSGGQTRTFVFPNDLGGDTANRTMLIGTEGLAALGIVRPDYVVPNGFFFQGGGSINFAEGSDGWTHPALPSDGRSLNRDGSTGTNSPRNFAGVTGTVPASAAAAPFNVHGLWWRSPAASEAGWGINIAHQGNILFMSWFTYDNDGSGLWMFMSDATRTSGNTYQGAIYRTTGAPFSAYDGTRLVPTPIGTGTFTFTDADNGTFSYTIGNVQQAKAITRFDLGTGARATCSQTGSHGANPNYTDLWRGDPEASQRGWGVNLAHQGDVIFLSWFTYGADGRGMWVFGSNMARTAPGVYTGNLLRSHGTSFSAPWNSASFGFDPVGSATLTFTDASNGTFQYTLDNVSQSKAITRNIFASPATICR